MADLASLRDKLIEARANGLRSVRDQNGETIIFKTDTEMASAIAALDRETAGRRPSVIYVNKGT
jgi:hypothetical protein